MGAQMQLWVRARRSLPPAPKLLRQAVTGLYTPPPVWSPLCLPGPGPLFSWLQDSVTVFTGCMRICMARPDHCVIEHSRVWRAGPLHASLGPVLLVHVPVCMGVATPLGACLYAVTSEARPLLGCTPAPG